MYCHDFVRLFEEQNPNHNWNKIEKRCIREFFFTCSNSTFFCNKKYSENYDNKYILGFLRCLATY